MPSPPPSTPKLTVVLVTLAVIAIGALALIGGAILGLADWFAR